MLVCFIDRNVLFDLDREFVTHSWDRHSCSCLLPRDRGALGIFLEISKLNSTRCKTRIHGLINLHTNLHTCQAITLATPMTEDPYNHMRAGSMQGLSWNRAPLRHIAIQLETVHVQVVPWRMVRKITYISVKITIQTLTPIRLEHLQYIDVVIEQS